MYVQYLVWDENLVHQRYAQSHAKSGSLPWFSTPAFIVRSVPANLHVHRETYIATNLEVTDTPSEHYQDLSLT